MFTLINISRSFTKSQWFSFSTESTGPVGHQVNTHTGGHREERKEHRNSSQVFQADSIGSTGTGQSKGGHRPGD